LTWLDQLTNLVHIMNQPAPVPVRTFSTADALGRTLAGPIADGIARASAAGRRYLLGCPGGRSARTTYQALTAEIRRRRLAVDHLVIAMMDEYVQPMAGGFACVPADAHFSCRGFADREIAGPLATAAGVDRVEVWLPDPGCPAEYGPATIAEHSRKAVLVLLGTDKKQATGGSPPRWRTTQIGRRPSSTNVAKRRYSPIGRQSRESAASRAGRGHGLIIGA
jgi:hypothetical protein